MTGPGCGLMWIAGKEGGDFFQGGGWVQLSHKLKSEIFTNKKSL